MNAFRRIAAAVGAVVATATCTTFVAPVAAEATPAFSASKTVVRNHWVDGKDDPVDTRKVSVTVSDTKDLRDRQELTVTWSGAHPTGGVVADQNSATAAKEEYPVVVMQCRGTDSDTVPANKQVSPETCWTQSPWERFQYSNSGFSYPPYRMDRYAPTEDRALRVNQPVPLPSGCADLDVPYWLPFVAADGAVYPGGNSGCGGMPPEEANAGLSLQPGNTTYGVADANGNGSTKFVIQNVDSNGSLGCSATVACTLEIIPIMGISCDAAGTAADAPDRGLPAAQRPPANLVSTVFAQCSRTGQFAPGSQNSGADPDLAVSGLLWFAASNWRNRIAVPLTMAPSSNVCDIVTNQATIDLYGSQTLGQATQQWAPKFCLDPKLFSVHHVQTPEPQAKNLLNGGAIGAAIQAAPPSTAFRRPVVQAPAAVTGFAIAYSIDGKDGHPYRNLRLDARLLAKLLAESYRGCATCLDFTSDEAKRSGFAALANNPIDMSRDPEFKALNPGISPTGYLAPAAALAAMSSDSDVMHALSAYINADPEARAWLDGTPDPWGMVVNPAYKGISLPVDNWPLLDAHLAQFPAGNNRCLEDNPVPWLPLVAAPVANPATIALNMQFDIGNSQVVCQNNGDSNRKLGAVGREIAGSRFVVGLVSLADAARYQLDVAQLQTQGGSSGQFSDGGGRTFVGPTDAGLRAAADLLTPDDSLGTWTLSYHALRTDARGQAAYPGTMLVSIDVATKGLPADDSQRYAALLRFVAGAGQTSGLASGQLPPGYLPLTAANGLGGLAAYTTRAAAAVADQKGAVPSVSGAATPTPGPSAGVGGTGTGNPGTGSGQGGTGTGTGALPSGPQASASASASASPSDKTSVPHMSSTPSTSPAAAAVARTVGTTSGVLGLTLPVLALLGLLSLGTAVWVSGLGRR